MHSVQQGGLRQQGEGTQQVDVDDGEEIRNAELPSLGLARATFLSLARAGRLTE